MVKIKRKRLRPSHQLPKKRVDELWEAYLKDQSATYVAETCKVNFRTARRYIQEGDPTRGIPAFEERMGKIDDKVRKKADAKVEKERLKSLKAVQDYEDRMIEALRNLHVDPDDLKPKDLEVLVRLKQFLLGEAESRHEEVESEKQDVQSKFSPAQLKAMAEALLDAEDDSDTDEG